jgi:DNA-directed RNA polymerase specialized sigma24 family protein
MRLRPLKSKPTMKTKTSRFDRLVARYYPAVYSLASRMTDDPRQAIVLAHDALESTRKRLGNRRGETAFASVLIAAVIRAGLTIA